MIAAMIAAAALTSSPDPCFGVDSDKLKGAPRYVINGYPATKDAVDSVIGAPSLPDYASKLRLTVIGPDASRAVVMRDIASNPLLAGVRQKAVVAEYAPDHWHVANAGFVRTGNPTIYLQAPDGTVLHRQDEYRGPEKLAEAVRKVDPSYDPAKDPDASKPLLPALPDFTKVPGYVWALAGVGVAILFVKKSEK